MRDEELEEEERRRRNGLTNNDGVLHAGYKSNDIGQGGKTTAGHTVYYGYNHIIGTGEKCETIYPVKSDNTFR